MMTIKLIQTNHSDNKVRVMAAKEIEYERCFYANKGEFMEQYKHIGDNVSMFMLFPEDDYSFSEGEERNYDKRPISDRTEFIKMIFSDEENEGKILFIQHARIYIMQGGQTVDTIYC